MVDLTTDRVNFVSAAAGILADQRGTAKEKFVRAGRLFWSALIYLDSWPRDLAERAQQISKRFMEYGTVECTAKILDKAAATARVRELAESVSSLAAQIELAERDGALIPLRPKLFRFDAPTRLPPR